MNNKNQEVMQGDSSGMDAYRQLMKMEMRISFLEKLVEAYEEITDRQRAIIRLIKEKP